MECAATRITKYKHIMYVTIHLYSLTYNIGCSHSITRNTNFFSSCTINTSNLK